ncbi:hypothetical protein AB0M02_22725 [Actinoplanes sp. NPDC051861]|uniref:hypothetical protein n=1 Tax=Actinoplanes sp. NPDC051861 TaxID=3155170 RepID=UPI0034207C5E
MVRRDDGGGGPSGVGYKLDVKVDSLRKLATELDDDGKDFHGEFANWDQKSKYAHPTNAQFAPSKLAGSQPKSVSRPFSASVDLQEANDKSYGQAIVAARMIEAGIGALFKGADILADSYKNLDDANAVSLSQITAMFPEPKKPAGGADQGLKLPPADQWVALKDGWDTNKDGKVDIPYGASGKKPENLDSDSKNDPPGNDDPRNREGWKPATDINLRDDDDVDGKNVGDGTGLDGDAYDDMKSRETIILAPGQDYGTGSNSGGGSTTMA